MQAISGNGGMANICCWYSQGQGFYYSSGHWKDLITKLTRGIRGLSGKYPAILNISRTGCVAMM